MHRNTRIYIALTSLLAAVAVSTLYWVRPSIPLHAAWAIAVLCGLAAGAEILQFALPRGARGSIAFVPFLACVIIAPSWLAPAAIGLIKVATEAWKRVGIWKTIFNAAQYSLALSLAVFTYSSLGGESLLASGPLSLLDATARFGLATVVSSIVCYLLNGTLVAIAIALDSGCGIADVWREIKNPATASLDVLAGPMVFMFAWVYATYGPIAAVAAWVPFIGYRHAHKQNLELEQTNRELLELMVKSLEARDPYTSGHSRRVQHFSTLIARALQLSPREVEQVSRAALLHDVGKIHEKYAPILSKTDRLTPDEWRIMKEHPGDGATLTSTMTKLQDIVPAIRHHHENWDGTGYPDGLAGELIPLSSRIIRFADTIDAMTTERPYRAPLSEAQVRAEIVRCRGTQFDPAIADKLLSSPLWTALFSPPPAVLSVTPKFSLVTGRAGAAVVREAREA